MPSQPTSGSKKPNKKRNRRSNSLSVLPFAKQEDVTERDILDEFIPPQPTSGSKKPNKKRNRRSNNNSGLPFAKLKVVEIDDDEDSTAGKIVTIGKLQMQKDGDNKTSTARGGMPEENGNEEEISTENSRAKRGELQQSGSSNTNMDSGKYFFISSVFSNLIKRVYGNRVLLGAGRLAVEYL